MQRNSLLYQHYKAQLNPSIHGSEPISPFHASIDPRFSNLLIRAANYREQINQQKVSPTNWPQSPSVITTNSNAWSPTETSNEKPTNTQKKSWLSPAWKTRLQGLLVGLAIAGISIAITLAVLLTRPSANSTTSAPACSSLQWNQISVTAAGNGTYGNGSNELSYPQGVYIDSNNALYVADNNNHRVQKWMPNAVNGITVAGVTGVSGCSSSGSNVSLLCYPISVYGDSHQNLYIADQNGISIWPSGASVGNRVPGSNVSSISNIGGIFVDNNGNLYASTTSNCPVRMWTPTATASTVVAAGNGCGYSSSQLFYALGITVDSSTNTIYAANSNAQTIVAWSVGGATGTIIAGMNATFGSTDFLLNYPCDVKRDPYGNLYVLDQGNSRVLLFCQNPPSTSPTLIAGYQLSYPVSIVLDSDLNLYVSSLNYNLVQKYTRIV